MTLKQRIAALTRAGLEAGLDHEQASELAHNFAAAAPEALFACARSAIRLRKARRWIPRAVDADLLAVAMADAVWK